MADTVRNGMAASRIELRWRKSRHSGKLGNCVEAASLGNGEVALRNSRYPGGPVLIFSCAEIVAFLAGAKDGEFGGLTS